MNHRGKRQAGSVLRLAGFNRGVRCPVHFRRCLAGLYRYMITRDLSVCKILDAADRYLSLHKFISCSEYGSLAIQVENNKKKNCRWRFINIKNHGLLDNPAPRILEHPPLIMCFLIFLSIRCSALCRNHMIFALPIIVDFHMKDFRRKQKKATNRL